MRFSKEDIVSLLRRMWEFRDNLTLLVMIFAPYIGITFVITWGLCYLCTLLELPYLYTSPIIRTLLSFSPIIPTMIVWQDRNHFGGESGITNGIMDACFTIWVIIVFYVWKAYN